MPRFDSRRNPGELGDRGKLMVATACARAWSAKLLVAALLVVVSVLAVASAAPASPTTPILDDFNRGLEDPLTQWGNWEPQSIDGSGPTLEALGGNAGVDEGDVHGDSYRTEPLPAGDAEVYGTIGVNPSDQRWMYLYLNLQDVGTPGYDGYEARWFHWVTGDGLYLRKIVNGVSTNFPGSPLQVWDAEEPSAGDQLLLRRVGSQLQFWHRNEGTWVLRLTANDSQFTGGRIGIGTDENKARWDDFGGTGTTTEEPGQLPVPATSVIDAFERDDEDPVSQQGGWSSTPTFGTGETLEVLSRAAGQNEGTVVEANSFRQTDLSGDAEVHARISAMPDNDQASYLYLNLQDPGTAGVDGYRMRWYHWIVADQLTIQKIVNGVATTLVGPAHVDPQVGDTLLLRRLDHRLELWRKSGATFTKLLTTVDPAFNAGRLGLGLNDQNGRWDDFGGGTLAAAQELSEREGLTLGACGNGVYAYSQDDCVSDPVNSLTGAFTTSETDLELPGVGVPLSWRRTYTSLDTTEGRLGPGWVDSFDASLTIEQNGDVRARAETGQRVVFTKNPDETYSGPPGTHSTLVKTASSYELTLQDQTKYTFDLAGKLQSKVDRHGIGVTLSYDGQGRLSTVTDSASRQLTLTYNPSGLVSGVADSAGRDVEYTYDAAGRLETVTDARGKVWTYAYDGTSSRLVSLSAVVSPASLTLSATRPPSPGTRRTRSRPSPILPASSGSPTTRTAASSRSATRSETLRGTRTTRTASSRRSPTRAGTRRR
jgi:YD repeat-containing protein